MPANPDDCQLRHRVRLLPAGVCFDVSEGESVFTAARRHGLRWPSICQGRLECGVCWMVVDEGWENISEMSPQERQRLAAGLQSRRPGVRLACVAVLSGGITVIRRGAGATDR